MFYSELYELEELGIDREDIEYAVLKITKEFHVSELRALRGFQDYTFEHYKNHNKDIDCLAVLINFLKDNREYEKNVKILLIN